jgi:anti-anti-sigma factor
MAPTRFPPECLPPSVELLVRSDGNCIVTCAGEFDGGNSSSLEEALKGGVRRAPDSIVLDLACVDFVDLHVASFLIGMREAIADSGTSIVLIGCVGQPARLLEQVGFEQTPIGPWGPSSQALSPPAAADSGPSSAPRVKTSAATPWALT